MQLPQEHNQAQTPQEMLQDAPQQPLNPYDIEAESAELEGINKELSDIEASIENDFAEFITDLVDNDIGLEELFFSDRKLFFKKIIEEQNKFVKSIIEPKQARAIELQDQISTKNELASIETIKQDFQARHPEVDIKELIHFFCRRFKPKNTRANQKPANRAIFWLSVWAIHASTKSSGSYAKY